MSAERGWIGDPQPSVEWRDSHYSRQADRINTRPDPCREREDIMPSWPGDYHYDPCDRCGYATRFKQFSMVCACTTSDLPSPAHLCPWQ